jgi:hypothetical protein
MAFMLTIHLPEDQLARPRVLASELGVSEEQFVVRALEPVLEGGVAGHETETRAPLSDEEFDTMARYVLAKNAELYRRLAP